MLITVNTYQAITMCQIMSPPNSLYVVDTIINSHFKLKKLGLTKGLIRNYTNQT